MAFFEQKHQKLKFVFPFINTTKKTTTTMPTFPPPSYASIVRLIIFVLMPPDGKVEVEGDETLQFWGKDEKQKSVTIDRKTFEIYEPPSDTQGISLTGSCVKITETTSTFMKGIKRATGFETRSYFD